MFEEAEIKVNEWLDSLLEMKKLLNVCLVCLGVNEVYTKACQDLDMESMNDNNK